MPILAQMRLVVTECRKRERRVIGVRVCGRAAGKAGLGSSARSGAAHGTAYTKLTRSTTM